MGVDALDVVPMVARVMCSGTKDCAKTKYIYSGETSCHSAMKLGGGPKLCSYGCIGLGSCIKACSNDAISIKNGVAVIDKDKCGACGQGNLLVYEEAGALLCEGNGKGAVRFKRLRKERAFGNVRFHHRRENGVYALGR